VIHRHRTGRTHYDLRILFPDGALRSWSLLKDPPARKGERRLAIERETFDEQAVAARTIEEKAFGSGRVFVWDGGEASIRRLAPDAIAVTFQGRKVSGAHELRRMKWYPGNHWLLEKK
jgi:hypothetical protein